MKIYSAAALLLLTISGSALANIEIELSGGRSTKLIKGENDESDVTVLSPDMNFYFGYRAHSFPLSIGFLVSQKNYDIVEYSKQLAVNAKSFYEDSSLFPSTADITTAESTGTWKGTVFGPQISISCGWKIFDPYLRGSYQVGTLKSVIDYKSTGNSMGSPVEYDFKIANDLKVSLLQYGLGFRIPMGMLYFLADVGIEKMSSTSANQTASTRTLVRTVEDTNTQTFTDTTKSDSDGQVAKVGLGLSF
ncbi:MAG: hypothetical protein H7318_05345 [Oligoflexus sp.]|nr:hypothetical protein [Oligoflexus sp.]